MNYIKEHWQGLHSLWRAYWINTILFSGLINAFYLIALPELLENAPLSSYNFELSLMAFIILIMISVWMYVGCWRSAGEYINTAATSFPKKSTFWGYVTQVVILFGALSSFNVYYPMAKDFYAMLDKLNSEVNTQYYTQLVGETDLILRGYINDESSNYVVKAFKGNDKLTTLRMDSPGGYLDAAFKLADYVESNNTLVVVDGQCLSACLLILASADVAYVTRTSQLAFHHPEGIIEYSSKELKVGIDEQTVEYYERFVRYGMPEDKLETFKEAGWTNLTIGEAYNLNLIDFMWDTESNIFYAIEDYCGVVDCFVTPVADAVKVAAEADLETNGKQTVESLQKIGANVANKGLPKRIDEVTILETVTAEGVVVIYHYELDINALKMDAKLFISAMEGVLVDRVCTINSMIETMDKGGVYRYSYISSDGFFVGEVDIDKKSCELN